MTERYAHLLPNADARVIQTLDRNYRQAIADVIEVGGGGKG